MSLVILSLITCQLIRFNYFKCHEKKHDGLQITAKVLIYTFAFVAMGISTIPVVLVSIAWANPQVTVFNESYLFYVEPSNNMTDNQTISVSDIAALKDTVSFGVFSKLVILLLTVSSFLSYLVFIIVLLCTYERCPLRCCKRIKCWDLDTNEDESNDALIPFCVEGEQSTEIYPPESVYFILLLLVNILLWIGCIASTWSRVLNNPISLTHQLTLDQLAFGAYMYSLLCTTVSCFIFSKLAYSVTHKCLELYDEFKNHSDDDLSLLIKKDDKFTKIGQDTLNRFEVWFTIHWVSYTITSFLLIVLFLEILNKNIQEQPGYTDISDTALRFLRSEIIVITLFTAQHCFLFLYPCFKAASVTVGREKLIKKINSHPLEGPSLSLEKKQLFIQYLKNKKFGFRISFFCARLRFGFNVAYISIFIGLLGVLEKFSDKIV